MEHFSQPFRSNFCSKLINNSILRETHYCDKVHSILFMIVTYWLLNRMCETSLDLERGQWLINWIFNCNIHNWRLMVSKLSCSHCMKEYWRNRFMSRIWQGEPVEVALGEDSWSNLGYFYFNHQREAIHCWT